MSRVRKKCGHLVPHVAGQASGISVSTTLVTRLPVNSSCRGVDLTTVKDFLGHKTLSMTLRYAHLAPAHKVAALSLLDTTLNQDPTIQKLYSPIKTGLTESANPAFSLVGHEGFEPSTS